MKHVSWLSLFLILSFALAGCAPASSTMQPTQAIQLPSPNILTATVTVLPTSTSIPTVTDTLTPPVTPTLAYTKTILPTVTLTPVDTLEPERIAETMQPLLRDPLNCAMPCFWGITPGKTSIDKVRAFFSPLGFPHGEGIDPNSARNFYSVGYESSIGRNSYVTFYISNNWVESIEIVPEITKQKEGSARQWIAYSQETLIKKYGQPSRVGFDLAWPGGGGSVIVMNMYFDAGGLIVQYTGENMLPSSNHSPRLCPLTARFDYVRLWLGPNPPYPLPSVSLMKATSLTIDQFTRMMLGEPKQACFIVNGNAFQ
jgi:hypothetical protein